MRSTSIYYDNIFLRKLDILKENKNKSGVYKWNCLITGKSYVGSSVSLSKRFTFYYSLASLKRVVSKESSAIYSAILKYGHENFSLDILEYCEPDLLISKEQYYIDELKPKYNILKFASSRFGHKLSEDTKKALSVASRGKTHIYKSRKNIGSNLKSTVRVNNKLKIIKLETRLKLSLRGQGVTVKVFDKSNNFVKQFPTMASTAKYFGFTVSVIRRIFNGGKSYDDYTYKFELKDLRIWVYSVNKELVIILDNAKKVSKWCNIPRSTLSNYIKSGKLYKDKYYFYNINSKSNSYFNSRCS